MYDSYELLETGENMSENNKKEQIRVPRTPNQEPTTARGRRRSNNTQEYQDNLKRRKQQSYPSR